MRKTSAIKTETIDVPQYLMGTMSLNKVLSLGAYPNQRKVQVIAVLTATNQIKVRPLSN